MHYSILENNIQKRKQTFSGSGRSRSSQYLGNAVVSLSLFAWDTGAGDYKRITQNFSNNNQIRSDEIILDDDTAFELNVTIKFMRQQVGLQTKLNKIKYITKLKHFLS